MNIDYTLWPNTDGNLGNKKVQIPDGINTFWPEGDALVGNFVYKDGKLAGFVDTKALTVNDSKSTTFPYDCVNIRVDKSLVEAMPFNKEERIKYFTIAPFDFIIIDFNITDRETINIVRTAKRVVDNKLYDADDNLIGIWNTSILEVGGFFDEETELFRGLFCNFTLLTQGERGFVLSEFNSDLSSLRNGNAMFPYCSNLTSFNVDLPSLTDGICMFYGCTNLTSFSSDLPSLTNGDNMFIGCTALTSFTVNLPKMTNGRMMFRDCNNLTTFTSNLSSLTNGYYMFMDCTNLTSFTSDLSSLTNGSGMFSRCKLNTASVQNIADTINPNPPSGAAINIYIGNSTPNEDEIAAFDTIASKGWTVYVNGSEYTPSAAAAIMTLDENGEEVSTPIPYYAKPVPDTEKTASYVDANGNFFNIVGAQFIYGDDISTYGMFTCEADAATNMGLTKIEKPSIIPSFKKS